MTKPTVRMPSCWIPPIVRWLIQVILPAWISIMPKWLILAFNDELTYETAFKGPEFLTFAMTISITSMIGLISVSPSLTLTELKPWRIGFGLSFLFFFILVFALRFIHILTVPRASFDAFEAYKRMLALELAGVGLALAAVVATITIVVIEICECVSCRDRHRQLLA